MGESKKGMRIVKVSAELLFTGLFGDYQREPDGDVCVRRVGIGPDMAPLPHDVRVERMMPVWDFAGFGSMYQVVLSSSRWEPVPEGTPIPELDLRVEQRIVQPDPTHLAQVIADRVMLEITKAACKPDEMLVVKLDDMTFDLLSGHMDDLQIWFDDHHAGFLLILHADDRIETIAPKAGDLVTISTGATLEPDQIVKGQRVMEEKFPGVRFLILPEDGRVENLGPATGTVAQHVEGLRARLAEIVAAKLPKSEGTRLWFNDGPAADPLDVAADAIEKTTGGIRMPDWVTKEIMTDLIEQLDAGGVVGGTPAAAFDIPGTQEWTDEQIAALKKEFHARHGGKDHGAVVEITAGIDPACVVKDPTRSPWVTLAEGKPPTIGGRPVVIVDTLSPSGDVPVPDRIESGIIAEPTSLPAEELAEKIKKKGESYGDVGKWQHYPTIAGVAPIIDAVPVDGLYMGLPPTVDVRMMSDAPMILCPFCRGKRLVGGRCVDCGRTSCLEGDPTNPDDAPDAT